MVVKLVESHVFFNSLLSSTNLVDKIVNKHAGKRKVAAKTMDLPHIAAFLSKTIKPLI